MNMWWIELWCLNVSLVSFFVAGYGMKSLSLEQYLTKPNIEKHNLELERERHKDRDRHRERERPTNDNVETEHRRSRKQSENIFIRCISYIQSRFSLKALIWFVTVTEVPTNMDTLESGSGCENGNTSPLYSNWDLHMQHLLPLQHYILEQAKLSGLCICKYYTLIVLYIHITGDSNSVFKKFRLL